MILFTEYACTTYRIEQETLTPDRKFIKISFLPPSRDLPEMHIVFSERTDAAVFSACIKRLHNGLAPEPFNFRSFITISYDTNSFIIQFTTADPPFRGNIVLERNSCLRMMDAFDKAITQTWPQ